MRKLILPLLAVAIFAAAVPSTANALPYLPTRYIVQGGYLGGKKMGQQARGEGLVPTLYGVYNCHHIGPTFGSCVSYVNLARTDGGRVRCSAQTFVASDPNPSFFRWRLAWNTMSCFRM
jgi:hypothetical protein